MAVESAADLASLFDDDEFAEGASYLAPGLGAQAVICTVTADRGQGRERFVAGDSSAVGSERHLWVRLTGDGEGGLATVARGGTFTMDLDGEVLRVQGLPKLDQTGKLWSVELVIAG